MNRVSELRKVIFEIRVLLNDHKHDRYSLSCSFDDYVYYRDLGWLNVNQEKRMIQYKRDFIDCLKTQNRVLAKLSVLNKKKRSLQVHKAGKQLSINLM